MVPRCKGDDQLTIVIDKKEYTINLKAASTSPCGYALAFQRWYWGNASRDMVSQAMKVSSWESRVSLFIKILIQGQPDGTFMIRDASTDGDFTLTLKVRGTDRLIKIICADGKCGFNAESLEFDTVLHLIDGHRECSLSEYNPDLNVPLTSPLGRLVSLGKRPTKGGPPVRFVFFKFLYSCPFSF